jgi:hypothetical protein
VIIPGTTQFWEEPPDAEALSNTCRYCGMPIRSIQVVCGDCKGNYIQLRKKTRAQVRRLIELAKERKAATREV